MKLIKLLLCLSLCMFFAAAPGLCASAPAVMPVAETSSLVIRSGSQTLLTGGADEQAVEAASIDSVSGIVKLCDHAEHSAAVDALAARYGVTVSSQGDELPMDGAAWQDGVLIVDIRGTRYAFGADAAVDSAITYRCDGSLIPYAGKTNESSVNIRADMSTKSAQVGKLNRGDLLTVLGVLLNADGECWYSVELADGTTGYIRSDLIISAIGEEASAPVEEAQTTDSGTRYIGNKKSKVFHYTTCKTLPAQKNQVIFDSRDAAVSKGYRPCQKCNP